MKNRIANELLKTAALILAEDKPSVIDGKSKQAAMTTVNKLMSPHTKGIFSDESWHGPQTIFEALRSNGIDFSIINAEYKKNDEGTPVSKTWRLEFTFTDNKGKPVKFYGVVVASACGPAGDNVFSKYDLVAYCS